MWLMRLAPDEQKREELLAQLNAPGRKRGRNVRVSRRVVDEEMSLFRQSISQNGGGGGA